MNMTARLVYRDAAGRELRTSDLEGLSGRASWQIVEPRSIPPQAAELHRQGREAGARGELDRALDLLTRAHEHAPDWPYPLYDIAFTHLLRGDNAKAEE